MARRAAVDPTIRRQVLASARHLFHRDRRTPVAAVAQRACVSRATLYRHFGSRQALFRAVEVEPPASARERVIASAADLISKHGLMAVSMERLASAAGVSRATVYRLFPSKAALFGEVVRTYSPFEEMLAILDRHGDDPPDVVLPEVARAMARIAHPRVGLLRAVIGEVATSNPDALAGAQVLIPRVAGRLGGYLQRQMEAGAIRRTHPVLAIQAVLGPVAFHILTRPIAERAFGVTAAVEDVAEEFARIALRGLATSEASA